MEAAGDSASCGTRKTPEMVAVGEIKCPLKY